MSNVVGGIADALVAAAEANKSEVLAALTAAEGGVEAAIVAVIQNLPMPGGIIGIAFPAIKGSLEAEVAKLVQANGPEIVFDFLDAEAHALAQKLGG